jgi:hypothetical protein
MGTLLQTFASLPAGLKEVLAETDSPMLAAFAALDIANNEAQLDRLTCEEIVACLEAAGVAFSKVSIARSLNRAGNKVSVTTNGNGDPTYKLMTKGKRDVEDILGGELLSVVRIEAGQPRTARIRLAEVIARIKGTVRICDPFYGLRSLDSLDHVPKQSPIRFLTSKTNESPTKLNAAIKDLQKERPNCEFKLAGTGHGIHDRYVLTDDFLLLLGHGLKDIGGKESFIVRLDKDLAPDLLKEIGQSFDARWQAGSPL